MNNLRISTETTSYEPAEVETRSPDNSPSRHLSADVMDQESLELKSVPVPGFLERLYNLIMNTGGETEEELRDGESFLLDSNILCMKSGAKLYLEDIPPALAKYGSINNINNLLNVCKNKFNVARVVGFHTAIVELMEAILLLPYEINRPYISELLKQIVKFYGLENTYFENDKCCYTRILKTSETSIKLISA